MAVKRKRRPARPTKRDLHLLEHPPTRTTWICPVCKDPVRGSLGACWVCGTSKPERPKLLWPAYVAAAKKAKTEPTGKRWTPKLEGISAAPRRAQPRITRKKTS